MSDECREAFEKWYPAYSYAPFGKTLWQAWQAAWEARAQPKALCSTCGQADNELCSDSYHIRKPKADVEKNVRSEKDFLADVLVKRIRTWAITDLPTTVMRCEMSYILRVIDDPYQFKIHFNDWLRTVPPESQTHE